jgi:hypothetical protein
MRLIAEGKTKSPAYAVGGWRCYGAGLQKGTAPVKPSPAGSLRFLRDQSDANREAHETRHVMDIEAVHDL